MLPHPFPHRCWRKVSFRKNSVPKHSLSGMSRDSRRLLNTRGRRDSRGTKVFERAMNSMQILRLHMSLVGCPSLVLPRHRTLHKDVWAGKAHDLTVSCLDVLRDCLPRSHNQKRGGWGMLLEVSDETDSRGTIFVPPPQQSIKKDESFRVRIMWL